MAYYLQTTPSQILKRTYTRRQVEGLSPVGLWATPFIRRNPKQNPPQFAGTIIPAGIRDVYLRILGSNYFLARTKSNAEGYFEFNGIWDERFQYEFCIINNDGTISKTYHIDYPAYSPWLGNPTVNNSSGYTRI